MRFERPILLLTATVLVAGCGPGPSPAPSASASASASASPDPTIEVAALLSERSVVRPSGGESFVNPGLVVRSGNRLHMLANSFTRYPGASAVTHLTSADGVEWRPAGGGPVLRSEQVPWAHETFTTSFLTSGYRAEDRTWTAYGYTFEGPAAEGTIWRATARGLDGPWRVDRAPVLEPGPEGSWDSVRVAEPSVVLTDEGLQLFYTGFDEEGVGRIGMATSTDGITWTKRDEPVFEGAETWDGGSVGNPQVVRMPDGLMMAFRTEAGSFGFGLARSTDGTTWEPSTANPVMTQDRSPDGAPFWQSEAVAIDDELRWWLEVGYGYDSTELYAYRLDVDEAW
jgi:predicted GH43/DUF377 family glycosyl hydrolase